MNALIAQDSSDVKHDPLEGTSRMNPFQLLNAITMKKHTHFKGLIYMTTWVNGKKVMAMVDTSATNNFVAQHMAD